MAPLLKNPPFVSVLTPTCNRRRFIPQLLHNFRKQAWPLDRMELIVADDGEDSVADLLENVPRVRYLRLPEHKPLGYKRNLLAAEATGDIIVHMDDDDYYPPQRVSHAVERLLQSGELLAGSSAMYIYDVSTGELILSGPFSPTHGTNGTFAYRREYLEHNRFDDAAYQRDEALFTSNFTHPMVQLDPQSTIVCIKHSANTWDKSRTAGKPAKKTLKQLIPNKDALRFYRYRLRRLLAEAGKT